MTWANSSQPAAPAEFSVNKYSGMTQLSWNRAPYTYYNIYASKTYPVDVEDIRNLVAQRVEGSNLSIATDKEYFYAVTAVNRYGVESKPQQSWSKGEGRSAHMLTHDNKQLQLPDAAQLTNARYVTIESLPGNIISTLPIQRTKEKPYTVDIHKLKDGVYVVKTLEKKGLTHRLGMFTIKR
jgi:hypothetical protein